MVTKIPIANLKGDTGPVDPLTLNDARRSGDNVILERIDGPEIDLGSFKGDKGQDGSNVLPTATAVAQAAVAAPGASFGRTIVERSGDEVRLEDFYVPADNNDWALTLTRAVAYATPLGKAVRVRHMCPYKTTATLLNDAMVTGTGPMSGFVAPTDAPVSLFNAIGLSGVKLDNFMVNGGMTTATTTKIAVRGVRFRSGSNIRLSRMFVKNCADWAVSFEACSNIVVRSHTHTGGGLGLPGGRDGLHFLDCSDVLVDGADIESGDDCIGITSESIGTSRVTVRNVRGSSNIGSVVIANEEGSTTKTIEDITIEGITAKSPTRNIVRVQGINGATIVRGVRVSGVTGVSGVNAGIQLSRITDVVLSDFNVTGQTHGVQVANCSSVCVMGGTGKSTLATYDGFNITSCTNVTLVGLRSSGSALWGIQVNGGSYITLTDCQTVDCGILAGPAAGGSNGGGLRIINADFVSVIGGSYMGQPTISKYGLSYGGASRLYISPLTRFGGEIPLSSRLLQVNVMQVPMCAAQFKDNGGTLTVNASMNCAVTRLAVGEYEVAFTEPDKVTPKPAGAAFPVPQITVGHPANAGTLATRRIPVITAIDVNKIRFQIINQDTNAMIAADYISVLIWDQP